MELTYTKKEKIAGVFVIFTALAVLAFIVTIGRGHDWFKPYIVYYTTFDESYNLNVNGDVKLFKANIGKIKKITPADDRVMVELLIEEEFTSRIREDTYVTVESPTFIGSEYISVYPGSPNSPKISEDGIIPSKEKKSISDILEEFQVEKTAKMFIRTIQDFANVAEELKNPGGPLFVAIREFSDTFANLQKITRSINEGNGTIGALIKSRETIEAINIVIEAIDKVVESLRATVDNLQKGSRDVPLITHSTINGIAEIREGVENIDRLVKSLEKNFFIKPNLPKKTKGRNIDAGLRN